MTIRRAQTERVLEEVTRTLYATGIKPTLGTVMQIVAEYFSKYPVGNPLPLPELVAEYRQVSSVDKYNQALAHLVLNLDVLYEVAQEQVDSIILLTAALQGHLERLESQRKRIETTIDDYLLSLYNSDGYYFSISDTFTDLIITDTALTSAHVDTLTGSVVLPAISALSKRLDKDLVGTPSIIATVDNQSVGYRIIAPFSGALEGSLQNAIWAIEVETDTPKEVVVTLSFLVGDGSNPIDVSRIDYNPYTISPLQMFVELGSRGSGNTFEFTGFGDKIETSTTTMSFTGPVRRAESVRFTLRKSEYDYTNQSPSGIRYRYLFGAKDISIMKKVYDNSASFVSKQLTLAEDLQSDMVIDAISLSVDQEIPEGTNITYFVASDPGDLVSELSELDWRTIIPVGGEDVESTIARFDGARTYTRDIVPDPQSNELQLIALDNANLDLQLRNPTPAIIPGIDVYRICDFTEEVLPSSFVLEEGVNTTNSYYTTFNEGAVDDLAWWAEAMQSGELNQAYGRIDVGNDFFYGGDIGESNISVYCETYLESPIQRETFLAEFSKPDQFSQTWDVRVFLNGREIGFLPVGTHKAVLPWAIREGLNHIALLVNIPSGNSSGTLNLLGGNNLFDYGTVKLGTWTYIDMFDMEYNQTGAQKTFTVNDGEIITRHKPTTNFRVRYSKDTGTSPAGVRFRADMERASNNPNITPKLKSYRLRFSYGKES
ncbi:MAG TPA: hypothetical protein VJ742_12140 [Nitrososphaera sp.]|nr:hypothetical protein [Nitrososphaera sp.]